jgi:TolB-like protein/DNA-binding winged helix-turn-helix (wHTH) protein/tetratricopeptide (TPR) repeat protein
MSDTGPPSKTYRFGPFVLDERRAELSGKGGRIPLRPQSLSVLLALVANPGRLMTKNDLHAKVWGNRAVTDDSLTQCLIDIRKALGDGERELIRTVPRRGYLFTGEVTVDAADETLPLTKQRSGRKLVAAMLVALSLLIAMAWLLLRGELAPLRAPLENSVAVLPFIDLSVRQDQQYLGNGLSEDIVSSLGKYPALRVMARTSTFSLAKQSADIERIRNTLNVAYVLEGSIRRTGDQVHVVAQLIDASDSTQVWSDSYRISQQELFSIQQVIAGGVAASIVPGLEPVVAEQNPSDLPAADLIWLARRYESEVREHTDVNRALLEQAIRLYREATAAAPNSALAYSRLAGALLYAGEIVEARNSVFRAMELDPDLSEVQSTLGTYYFAINRPIDAAAAWKKAIDLNPSNVDALGAYATWHWLNVESAPATEYYRRALELDPLNLSRYADFGFYLASNSRSAETEEIIRSVEELFSGVEAMSVVSRLLYLTGRIDESIAWTIRVRDLEPGNAEHVAMLAEKYVDLGDYDTALKLMPEPNVGMLMKMRRYDEFIDEAELLMIDEPDDVHLRHLLAFAYNVTGRSGEAVRIFGELNMLQPGPIRQVVDSESQVVAADALAATGNVDAARELASWWLDTLHVDGDDWWKHLYSACALAVLEKHDEALERFALVPLSHRVPWLYLARDSRCFRRYAGEERYQRVLAEIDERLAEIRARLPQTLEEFDVKL